MEKEKEKDEEEEEEECCVPCSQSHKCGFAIRQRRITTTIAITTTILHRYHYHHHYHHHHHTTMTIVIVVTRNTYPIPLLSPSALPHLTSPHLTSPHHTSPHFTSPHLTSPHSRFHTHTRLNPFVLEVCNEITVERHEQQHRQQEYRRVEASRNEHRSSTSITNGSISLTTS
uniref:Uncharacterized protein n=1 Tax=Vespula pensylvanica TaxID=30213 RepID=A0A834P6H8_VESPE|nr:hypothetical protein H0235_006330 [Vespula pensylvanica]